MSLIISNLNLVCTSIEMLVNVQNECWKLLIGTNTLGR